MPTSFSLLTIMNSSTSGSPNCDSGMQPTEMTPRSSCDSLSRSDHSVYITPPNPAPTGSTYFNLSPVPTGSFEDLGSVGSTYFDDLDSVRSGGCSTESTYFDDLDSVRSGGCSTESSYFDDLDSSGGGSAAYSVDLVSDIYQRLKTLYKKLRLYKH